MLTNQKTHTGMHAESQNSEDRISLISYLDERMLIIPITMHLTKLK